MCLAAQPRHRFDSGRRLSKNALLHYTPSRRLERHHAVAVGEQLRHVGRGDPAPSDLFEIIVVRPTGDGATLSDKDRHFVVA